MQRRARRARKTGRERRDRKFPETPLNDYRSSETCGLRDSIWESFAISFNIGHSYPPQGLNEDQLLAIIEFLQNTRELVMEIDAISARDTTVTCENCEACCCRLEVMLITDTGVPFQFTEIDMWGGTRMARLEDGLCAALDRNIMLCMIYEKRPWICREFKMGGYECISERVAYFKTV